MKHCPNDGWPYSEEVNFCPEHGEKLVAEREQRRCLHCETPIKPTDAFCRQCGERTTSA